MINLVSEIFKVRDCIITKYGLFFLTVLIVISSSQLLGGVDGAKYFRLSDISFDMETDYKMVIKILRELYMHGVIRSAGTTDIADQQV